MECEERKDTGPGDLSWEIKRIILSFMISIPIWLVILALIYFEKIGPFLAAVITVIIVALIFFWVVPKIIELDISFVILFYIGAMFLVTTITLLIWTKPSFEGLFFMSVGTAGCFALAAYYRPRKSTA